MQRARASGVVLAIGKIGSIRIVAYFYAVLLFGQEVRPGTRDDIAVFWSDGEQKRVIVGSDYGETHATLERILRKFRGGRVYYESLRAKVSELSEPGEVIVAILGAHCVGLMRPLRLWR